MPELPDVEAFRQVLASCAQGRLIRRVEVRDTGVLHGFGAGRLRRELEGRSFAEPGRHGKWLLARTDQGPTLLLHFGMTGALLCCDPADPADAHDRVLLTVDGGRQLRYRDQRKLKGLWLADDSGVDEVMGRQGPDGMAVDRAGFDAALAGRRGGVKAVLTDQSALAGLGNLLADEILWRARLHPRRRAGGLTDAERGTLYAAMRRTLRSTVRAGRVPARKSWLTGHRDGAAEACPRCAGPLSSGRVAGRGTVWCPRCQPEAS